jgi:glycosyltransferase involved in cell wall biosynthesis
LKIAVISSQTYSCPPVAYGGEAYYYDLACAFSVLGHDVTLYAATGSKPPPGGRLRYLPNTYGNIDSDAEYKVVEWYLEEVLDHDLILDCSHAHYLAEHIFYFRQEHAGKVLNVLNGPVTISPRPQYNLVVGSQKWKQLMLEGRTQFAGTVWETLYGGSMPRVPEETFSGVVYWATNADFYHPGDGKDDWFLWLSRPTPYKGLHRALRLAELTGVHLKVAMSPAHVEHEAWAREYLAAVENARERGARIDFIRLRDTLNHHQVKRELYQRARALVYPIESHEPFGMVVVEALSCGTPVIASKMGAMEEIIEHGVDGFLCDSDEDFAAAIGTVGEVNPGNCRRNAIARWDRIRAAGEYLELPR